MSIRNSSRKGKQLKTGRIRDRAKGEAETEEQRMARLQRKCARESDRLAVETREKLGLLRQTKR